ncbi:DNA-binding SARP family transcriptional activator [Micromonospora sp. A200]|nr:DNA-binding SARP family transcriptional activator [Micromonospora sp. A200]
MNCDKSTRLSTAGSTAPQPVSDAEATVRLLLLGGFRLLHGRRPVVVPRGLQRTIALIGLRPGATRAQLAGLLWPGVPEERALSSLRTALWRLRRDPSCPVIADGDTVRLHPTVDVDVDELARADARVSQGGDPRPAAAVLAAGRHDLLPGWYDDWVLLERERLRQLRLHLLDEMARAHLRAGEHGEALQAALEAMAAEPLRETPHRLVVQVHLAEGNACEALHAYFDYRDLLRRELQLEPSAAMRALISEVLASHDRPRQAPAQPARGVPRLAPGPVGDRATVRAHPGPANRLPTPTAGHPPARAPLLRGPVPAPSTRPDPAPVAGDGGVTRGPARSQDDVVAVRAPLVGTCHPAQPGVPPFGPGDRSRKDARRPSSRP